MEEIEKRARHCELVVHKTVCKLIEKILRYWNMDFSHERFKAIIFSMEEYQTPLEEKIKNYYDAYMYLLMNHKSPFTSAFIRKFYYIIFEKELEESIALKIASRYIFLSTETKIMKAIELHFYVYSLLSDLKEFERWLISLMFLNYALVKQGIPCVYLIRTDLEKYAKYRNDKEKLKTMLYNVILFSKFQKKSYTKQLRKITLEEIEEVFRKKRELLQERYKIEHIFLYGSFAKDTARLDSDLDLFVIFKEDISYQEKMQYKEGLVNYLTSEFCRYVDIQEIFECIPKEIILEATRTKKLL